MINENIIILINKPTNNTSFDICYKLRKIYNTTKIGHTGTLDPNATGLLMVMINKACKILPYIVHSNKTYISTIKLGIKTDSKDIWGNILKENKVYNYKKEDIIKVLNSFIGDSLQIPPLLSAIKVKGKRLYSLYHQGVKDYKIDPRLISINSIELLDYNNDIIKFKVNCSSGTYIRVLCEDIAEKLNTIGCMSSLVRIAIDDFKLEDAIDLKDININSKTFTIEEILSKYYQIIEVNDIDSVKNGKRLILDSNQDIVLVSNNNKILAVYEKDSINNNYRCKRGLW